MKTFRNKEQIQSVFIAGQRVEQLWKLDENKNPYKFYQYEPQPKQFENLIENGSLCSGFEINLDVSDDTYYDDTYTRIYEEIGDTYTQNGGFFVRRWTAKSAPPLKEYPSYLELTDNLSSYSTISLDPGRYFIRIRLRIKNNNDLNIASLWNGEPYNNPTKINNKNYIITQDNWNLLDAEWSVNEITNFNFLIRLPSENVNLSVFDLAICNAMLIKLPDGIFAEDVKTAMAPDNYFEQKELLV